MEKLFLRPAEAAAAVGIGRTSLYQLLASGDIPSATIGRARLIPADGLRQWAERQWHHVDEPSPSAPPAQPAEAV